jgi:hypothetical protein
MILLKHLASMLDRTFGPTLRPTELLGLDRGENGRKFGRGFDFWSVHKLPAFSLRSVTQIQILRQGIVMPVARIQNAGFSPNPSCTIEIDKGPLLVSSLLLD